MKSRAILVTGAAGFVGRHLCQELAAKEIPYIGVDNQAADAPGGHLPIDIRDRDAVGDLFRSHEVEVVIHLAAILPTAARKNPKLATEVNILGSCNLLEAAAQAGVSRFVFGSSMGVYGREGNNVPLDEEVTAAPTDVYGGTKRYIELYGENLANTGALKFLSLRIATVVGLGVRNTASPWRSQIFEPAVNLTAIPCGADAVLSLVHAEDAAAMLAALALREDLVHRTYNTPADNWRAGDLKTMIESISPLKHVLLDEGDGRATPPVADGTRLEVELYRRSRPLTDRLRAALTGTGHQSESLL